MATGEFKIYSITGIYLTLLSDKRFFFYFCRIAVVIVDKSMSLFCSHDRIVCLITIRRNQLWALSLDYTIDSERKKALFPHRFLDAQNNNIREQNNGRCHIEERLKEGETINECIFLFYCMLYSDTTSLDGNRLHLWFM